MARPRVKEPHFLNVLRNGTDSFKELAVLYVSTLTLGGLVFSFAEHQSIFNSMWWAVVTALTVGYGDLYPHTAIGKIDGVVLMHVVTLFIIPIIIGRMAKRIIDK